VLRELRVHVGQRAQRERVLLVREAALRLRDLLHKRVQLRGLPQSALAAAAPAAPAARRRQRRAAGVQRVCSTLGRPERAAPIGPTSGHVLSHALPAAPPLAMHERLKGTAWQGTRRGLWPAAPAAHQRGAAHQKAATA